jgi:hypothetical protein
VLPSGDLSALLSETHVPGTLRDIAWKEQQEMVGESITRNASIAPKITAEE